MVKRLVFVAGLLAGFAVIPAQPVLADPATHQSFLSGGSGENMLSCPSFAIDNAWNLSLKSTVWIDSQGNLTRSSGELHYSAVLTKWTSDLSTILATYTASGSTHGRFDGASGTSTFSGLMMQIVGPNGVIAKDVGRLVIDANGNIVSQSGQQDPLAQQLCNALA